MQTEKLEIAGSRQALSALAENVKTLMNWHLSPTAVVVDLIKPLTPAESEVDMDLDDDYRHWSPESEPYAPADVLLQYLRDGWSLDAVVKVESHQCQSCRYVDIYYFTLHHHAQQTPLRMPIVANPVVRKLVQQYKLNTICILTNL